MPLNIPQYVKNWVRQSLDKTGKFSHNKSIRFATDEVKEWNINSGLSERQIAWLVLHDMDDVPCCRTCGKPLRNFERKGITHCSQKCAKNDPETTRKLKETNLAKYGTEYSFQSEHIKEKIRTSCLAIYGVENAAQSEIVKEKAKATMLERYGVEHALQAEIFQQKFKDTCNKRYNADNSAQTIEIQNKIRQTNLERYGHANPQQNDEVKRKTAQTNLERYGHANPLQNDEVKQKAVNTLKNNYNVDSPLKSKEILQKAINTTMLHYGVPFSLMNKDIQDKIKQTSIEKYGCENPAASNEIRSKIKATCMEKYGVECSLSSSEIKHKLMSQHREKIYEQNVSQLTQKQIDVVSSKDEVVHNRDVSYKCRICGTEFILPSFCCQAIHCPSCLKRTTSAKEKNILDFIKSVYSGNIIENTKKIIPPYELDIYIPEKKLAVEFNGTYWHSSSMKDKSYHLNKTLACQEKGIRLIHVFEWEWDKNAIVIKNLLSKALGIVERKIYARECSVREISQSDYKAFLSLYHLQGSINSSIRLGLYFNDELVMVSGWGKSRFNSKDMELHRLCTKEGIVVGGFSRLIAHSGINHFISYVDRAHFTGEGYIKSGFVQIGTTPPGYKWIKDNEIVVSRQMAQKSKLHKLLGEGFNPELTEVENMKANGWIQIYDCGNLKMEWNS